MIFVRTHDGDRQFRIARRWSNTQLRLIAPMCVGRVVNVSAGDDEDKEGAAYAGYFSAATSYTLTNFRAAYRGFQGRSNEIELDLSRPLPAGLAGSFDVVFNHTTLEHVFEVRTAFRALCELSGDLVIVVVPFAQVQHENVGYQDFWRFTPTCLRALFAENGLDVVYEAANDDFNASVYLFVVGSRCAERWGGRFPAWQPLDKAASWIGSRRRPLSTVRRWLSRRLRGVVP
jgi:hypothetical protein